MNQCSIYEVKDNVHDGKISTSQTSNQRFNIVSKGKGFF